MDLHSTRKALRKHWKWLAVSALVVAWITASCGQYALSTSRTCTSITTAIRGLLLHIENPGTVQPSNTKTDNTSRRIILSDLQTSVNSFARYENKIQIIKSAISIAVNTATITKDLIITSVCLTTRSRTNNYLKMRKGYIHIRALLWRNSGLTDSLPWQNLTSKLPAIRLAIRLKKSREKGPWTIISGAMSTEKPIGYYLSTAECRRAEINPAA